MKAMKLFMALVLLHLATAWFVPDCDDTSDHCTDWAKNGFCSSTSYTQEQKKQYCAKTCSLCDPICTGNGTGGSCVNDDCPTGFKCLSGTCCNMDNLCQDASPNCENWSKNGFCTSTFYTDEQKKEYCALTCDKCDGGSGGQTSTCGGSFSPDDRQQTVNAHNALRSQIAQGVFTAKGKQMPAAMNMRKIVWDCDLENSAQAWANKCVFQHSGAAGKGENLYMIYGGGQQTIAGKGRDASLAWANEFQQYGWLDIKLTQEVFNTGIGHATQMAWADTGRVGCGASLCSSNTEVIVVCQYQTQGNILNTNVYNPGGSCAACPAGTICDSSTKLCI